MIADMPVRPPARSSAARGHRAGFADQHERILRAATGLFAEHGYAATSMNQIAEAAGLSKPALYHYVRDKDALLVQIAEPHLQRLADVVQQAAGSVPPTDAPEARQRLAALVEQLVRQYADAQAAHRVLTEDIRFMADADRQRLEATERRIVAGLAGLIAGVRPDLSSAELAKPLTMLLFGMINWMFKWLRHDGPWDHAALAPVVADLFVGGLDAVRLADLAGHLPASRSKPATETTR